MRPIIIKPVKMLRGTVTLPGDKSISHRAAILAALSCGKTEIKNFLFSDDCLVTLKALAKLGVKVVLKKERREVTIVSSGTLEAPKDPLFMGESGTTARIFLGLLAGQNFSTSLTASPSLSKRPMARVIEPLARMGADMRAQGNGKEKFFPIEVISSALHGIQWRQQVPSAQVKSAILLAGLFATGRTVVKESLATRDHTERMMQLFGAHIRIQKNCITVSRSPLETPGEVVIPGDISSAVFFIVAALLVKDSKILIRDAGVNPTRMGAVSVLKRMGGRIKLIHTRHAYEPMADIEVSASPLTATLIKNREIPALIDELPILMVAASLAKGTTIIEGAGELRVKETDRIRSMVANLTKLGVNIKVKDQKNKEIIKISGVNSLKSGSLKSFSDHRTAMSMFVAGLTCDKISRLDDESCIKKSFPDCIAVFKQLFVT